MVTITAALGQLALGSFLVTPDQKKKEKKKNSLNFLSGIELKESFLVGFQLEIHADEINSRHLLSPLLSFSSAQFFPIEIDHRLP